MASTWNSSRGDEKEENSIASEINCLLAYCSAIDCFLAYSSEIDCFRRKKIGRDSKMMLEVTLCRTEETMELVIVYRNRLNSFKHCNGMGVTGICLKKSQLSCASVSFSVAIPMN